MNNFMSSLANQWILIAIGYYHYYHHFQVYARIMEKKKKEYILFKINAQVKSTW